MVSKALLVARREYLENLRTKAFWIGILVFPVMIAIMIAIPVAIERSREARRYAVVDRSGWLLAAVESRAAAADLVRALREARERKGLGGSEWSSLPEPLRQAADSLATTTGETGADAEAAIAALAGEAASVLAPQAPEGAGTRNGAAGAAGTAPPAAAQGDLARSLAAWWRGLDAQQAASLEARLSKERFARVEVGGGDQATLDELNRRVASEELFAYFALEADPLTAQAPGRYVSANLTDEDLYEWFTDLAREAVRERRFASRAIDPQVASWIQTPVRFEMRKIGKTGTEEEVSSEDFVRQYAPVAFVYLLWVSVFSTAQMLLTNTVEEKSNRIMEVLLSSVSPLELMMGKIAGIAATGLTVIGTWVTCTVLAAGLLPSLLGARLPFDLGSVAADPLLLGSFVAYFFLGYLLLAAMLVGLGSVCNSLKEAQNLVGPVMVMLFIPLATMMPIGKDPNGTLAKVMSFIPPFTPFVMMNRAAGPPSLWEYVLTTLLLVASIAAALWAAAKIFRIGVLMTGKPPRLREILRWLRAPVGQVPVRKGEEAAA